jgi:hypothetical protein
VSWPINDLADAFFTLLRAAPGSPALAVYDGEVPDSPAPAFALVYFYIETPDGLMAPDAVPLTLDSEVIDARAYVQCVGSSAKTTTGEAAKSARAVAGRVRSQLLNKTLVVPDRSCFPIRWLEGTSPQRDEDIPGWTVFNQRDVYGWRSVPA